MIRSSLRYRLLFSFLGLATIPLLLTGGFMGWRAYQQGVEDAYARQTELARRVAVETLGLLRRYQYALESAVRLSDLDHADREGRRQVLEKLLTERDSFRELAYQQAQGGFEVHLSNVRLLPPGHSHEPSLTQVFEAVVATGAPAYGRVYFDAQSNEPLMILGFPVNNPRAGTLAGVITAEVRLRPIWDLVAGLQLAPGEDVYLLDEQGDLIAHRNPSEVLRGQRLDLAPDRQRQPGLHGRVAFTTMVPIALGQRRFSVVAERDTATALRPALENATTSALVVFIFLLGAWVPVVLIARHISRPIVAVAETARAISNGDLQRRVEVANQDEIGELAATFNSMTDRLLRSMGQLEGEVQQRRQAQREMEKANRAYQALSMSNRAVTRASDELALLQEACRIVKEDCGYRLVWIGKAEHDLAKTVRPVAEAGCSDGYLNTVNITWADNARGRGPTGTAIRERRPVFIRDIQHNPSFAPWREQASKRGYASSAAFPILDGDEVLGALMVYSVEVDAFVEDEIGLLSELAENIGLGLGKLRNQQELERHREHLAALVEERTSALQREQGFLQAMLENISDGIVACDERGLLSLFNRASREIHGVEQQRLPPERWAEYYQLFEADGETLMRPEAIPLWRAYNGERVINQEMVIQHRDGSRRTLLASGQMILDQQGHKTGAVATMHDISEQKQAAQALLLAKEAAEAANRAKSVFLANMSHELRTPLNAILGFAQLLRLDATLSSEHRRQLETINQSGQHLLSLINDILEISRIESGRVSFQSEPFDLQQIVQGIAEMIRIQAERKGLAFILDQETGLPRHALGDGPHLKQVLINLLGNAVKYTEQGEVALWVMPAGAGRLRFEVRDTGPGIAKEDQSRLFQPFYQTDYGVAKGEGTGLGLAISREFVRLMGGEIELDSTLGKGSSFAFTIPLPEARSPAVAQALPSRVVGLAPGQPETRVLVVEDHRDNRDLFLTLLGRVGFQVQGCENGEQAIEAFLRWRPHLIWMDMRMPVLDGYQATRRIRALPGGDRVRIVALTASAFAEERAEILDAGCDELVTKPAADEQLFRMMGELLGVQYRYQEPPPPSLERTSGEFSLEGMPDRWLQELQRASLELDREETLAAIERIAERHPATADALRELVENYRFDQIVEACQLEQTNTRGCDEP